MIKKFTPRIIATLLIVTMGLFFSACGEKEKVDLSSKNEQSKPTITAPAQQSQPAYESTLTYAAHGIGEESVFISNALNGEKISSDTIQHLPIFKFESKAELDDFKTNILSNYDLWGTHNEVVSLNSATQKYDDSHFETNTVFLIAVPATSGSTRHKVNDIVVSDGELLVSVKAESPEAVTMDLVSWFIIISIDKTNVANCTSFDAVLV